MSKFALLLLLTPFFAFARNERLEQVVLPEAKPSCSQPLDDVIIGQPLAAFGDLKIIYGPIVFWKNQRVNLHWSKHTDAGRKYHGKYLSEILLALVLRPRRRRASRRCRSGSSTGGSSGRRPRR
jgi:hypothetical protein